MREYGYQKRHISPANFQKEMRGVVLHLNRTESPVMARQSITLTEKNDAWLKNHVDNIQDYANKSELINDLIRSARRAEAINNRLKEAESSGFVSQDPSEILNEFKAELKA